jgi:hypothetical protein
MKLHTIEHEVERSNVSTEQVFTIKTTAKAFSILSDGLYTDQKLAVIRELSCNAYDAHIAAGNADTPFEIHLPNKLEPWFSIRDFGTGLSDPDVMSLYTTYFESTKTNSNDYIGALGLGSKSPFSYTKAFEVVSRFGGMRRIYSVFINEAGLPTIARLGEFHTDEHNGLEIKITVDNTADQQAFYEKTAKCLRWFPVKPNVVGAPSFTFTPIPKERIEGEGWKMFEPNFAGDYSKMTAVQGNVAYKVDITKLGLSFSDTKILEHSHLVGFFDIGELEVAANREEIRYDDRSKAALTAKIASCRVGVLKSIEDQADELKDKCWWDAIIQLNALAMKVFSDRTIFKRFVEGTENAILKKYLKYWEDGAVLETTQLRGHEISIFEQTTNKGSRTLKRKEFGRGLSPEAHIFIFYNDLPTGGVARVMEWTRNTRIPDSNHRPVSVVIRPKKDYEDATFNIDDKGEKHILKKLWTEEDYVKELAKFREELGDVKFFLASKDTPVPERKTSYYKQELPVFQYGTLTGKYKQTIAWTRTPDVDLAAGGLYFHLLNGTHIALPDKDGELQPIGWGVSMVHSNLTTTIDEINAYLGTKYTMKNLYGFGSQAINKIKKNQNWVNIFDVLREVVKKYDEASKFFDSLDITSDIMGIKFRCTKPQDKEWQNRVLDLDVNSSFRKTITPLMEDYKKFGKFTLRTRFAKQINIDLKLGLFDNKGQPYFNATDFEKYPMLNLIHNLTNTSGKELKTFFDYIALIDRS